MAEPPRLSEITLPEDHVVRSDENLESKWIYVQENPVRAGFVKAAEDWLYYLDFVNDGGKLSASPTERIPRESAGVDRS
jgi:hypothetical protein